MNGIFAGVDLGGTKTRIGAVLASEPGRVMFSVSVPTVRDDPDEGVTSIASLVRQIVSDVNQALGDRNTELLGVGVGAPGPLDIKERELLALPNLPKWRGFAIGRVVERELGVPVTLENDANAAAVGEKMFGAGREFEDFVYVTLGTGVGGALILNGELYRGHWGGAGEIGHVQVDSNGPLCGCGRRGCVEALAAGPAIEKAYGRPPAEVFALAASGDRRAREVLESAGRALGRGLAQVFTVLDPQAVVFGGGMAKGNPLAFRLYLDSCKEELEKRAFLPAKRDIPHVVSTLGVDAAILGAAWLAREEYLKAHQMNRFKSEALPKVVEKPWGKEVWWAQTPRYAAKTIYVNAGHSLSLQYHQRKFETMFFSSGEGSLYLGSKEIPVKPGLSVDILPGTVHRVTARTDLVFHEASTPEMDDVIRLEDNYGRTTC
ncbi:MAG TPA: ROK family protein [Firmicutes bacterium]|nr:ROK family protein [Candidatus Fermentithermobacillaceae bacterium]